MHSDKTLTVFTPTYNRDGLLPRGYAALCRQTSHDFCWLIIDDGSKDGTLSLVTSWLETDSIRNVEGGFEGVSSISPWLHIRYCYKENGGLHTAYNKAIELMDTEICVCIDSDDYMPDDAVGFICSTWIGCKADGLIGIIGRDYYLNGNVVGEPLPNVKTSTIIDLMDRYNHQGDKKVVMRVDLLKAVGMQPTYAGEVNFNPIYTMLKLDKFGSYLLVEHNLCYVDYQDSGMAANIYKQFVNSPNSFCALRSLYLSFNKTTIRFRIKNTIHLAISACLAHDMRWVMRSNYMILSILFLPVGYLLSKYVKHMAQK